MIGAVRAVVAAGLAFVGIVAAIVLGRSVAHWTDELAIESPLARVAPRIADPRTPRLAGRVVLVIVDGLRVGTSRMPVLDELRARGSRGVRPPPPIEWPVDEARRVAALDALGPTIAALAAGDAALIAVHVIDVDRAGHASGVGDDYRAAARATDRMLRVAFAQLDLARDTVIVTADHGHVASGGHGGTEPEVETVPVVIAGAGIVPGATARDATLMDVAPTVAALLGVPAPGHAEGRTLVELLALAPDAAQRRVAADAERVRAIDSAVAAAHADVSAPQPWRVVSVGLGALIACALAIALRRRGALDVPAGPRALAGAVALVVVPLATVAMMRGHVSPSYVPTLARAERYGGVPLVVAIVAQTRACLFAIRRARGRLAAAHGLAVVRLAVALVGVRLLRAWVS